MLFYTHNRVLICTQIMSTLGLLTNKRYPQVKVYKILISFQIQKTFHISAVLSLSSHNTLFKLFITFRRLKYVPLYTLLW